jgi:hypothetical protein
MILTIERPLVLLSAAAFFLFAGAGNGTAQLYFVDSDALVTQSAIDNVVTEADLEREASIARSIMDNAGIVQFNQDAGNSASQANVVALGLVEAGALTAGGIETVEALMVAAGVNNQATQTNVAPAASILEAVIGNIGITQLSQNAGNAANQGIVAALALAQGSVAYAESGVEQSQTNNGAVQSDLGTTATITDSVNDNTGITGVNQSAGNLGNQHMAISIAGASSLGVVSSESSVEQSETGNVVGQTNVATLATATGSMNNNTGILQGNQDVGNSNNQANVVALALTDEGGMLTAGGIETVEALATAAGSYVVEAFAIVDQSQVLNTVDQTNVNPAASIVGSINGNAGIVQFSQGGGNSANQSNVVALALAGGGDAAFALGAAGQSQDGNVINQTDVSPTALIQDSINNNGDITQVNQDVGNSANQTNVVAIGYTGGAVAYSVGDVTQSQVGNVVNETNVTPSAMIVGSMNGNAGITQVNQHVHNTGNQANVVALGLTGGGGAALFEDVSYVSVQTENAVTTSGGVRTALITDSLNGYAGTAQVNQSAGNFNNQANILAMAVGLSQVDQAFMLADDTLATVSANNTVLEDPDNPTSGATVIEGAFEGFQGIGLVTQVTGDSNTVTNLVGVSVTTVVLP